MEKRLYLFLAVFVSFNTVVKTDITDLGRRPEHQEDYTKGTQESGFLHETYQDKEGNVHRRFAPIEGIFGIHRKGNDADEKKYKNPKERS